MRGAVKETIMRYKSTSVDFYVSTLVLLHIAPYRFGGFAIRRIDGCKNSNCRKQDLQSAAFEKINE